MSTGKMNKRVEIVADKTLNVVEEDIPKPPPKGMIVKVHYAGMCGSDAGLWHNELRVDDDTVIPYSVAIPNYQYPRVLGHEISGEVYDIGEAECPGAPKFTKGDLVVIYPWTGCDTCNPCTKRRENLCPQSANSAYGVGKDGGYQSYCTVELRPHVQLLPKGFPMEVACQLPCGGLTTYSAIQVGLKAVEEALYLSGIARVLIVGVGGVGQWALKWAKALYPPNTLVFFASRTQDKLDNATKAGADGGVLWETGLNTEEIKKRTLDVLGGQIDAAIDCVSSGVTAGYIQDSIRRGGCHVPVGLVGGTYKLPMAPHAMDLREIHGVYVGNSQQLEEVVNYVATKKVVPPPVTIHKPEEAEALIQQISDGKMAGRAVLKFI